MMLIIAWPTVIFVLVFLLAIAFSLVCENARRKSFRPITMRPCAGREWRRHFPVASKADIREFLVLFEDAFAVGRKHALKFRPDDRIMDVYRAVNPPKWTMADQLELEIFGLSVEDRYGVSLPDIWRDDLTLGDVFAQAKPGSID